MTDRCPPDAGSAEHVVRNEIALSDPATTVNTDQNATTVISGSRIRSIGNEPAANTLTHNITNRSVAR